MCSVFQNYCISREILHFLAKALKYRFFPPHIKSFASKYKVSRKTQMFCGWTQALKLLKKFSNLIFSLSHCLFKANSHCTDRRWAKQIITGLQYATSQTLHHPTNADWTCTIGKNKRQRQLTPTGNIHWSDKTRQSICCHCLASVCICPSVVDSTQIHTQ